LHSNFKFGLRPLRALRMAPWPGVLGQAAPNPPSPGRSLDGACQWQLQMPVNLNRQPGPPACVVPAGMDLVSAILRASESPGRLRLRPS
jgi:hypothetical protein